jgi:cell division protein FtsI (penicillin-binding protein 3)
MSLRDSVLQIVRGSRCFFGQMARPVYVQVNRRIYRPPSTSIVGRLQILRAVFLKKHLFGSFRKTGAPAQNLPSGFDLSRASILAAILLGLFGVLIGRAAIIQIFPPSEEALKKIAAKQYEQRLLLAPYRGHILDRNGQPLAISLKKPSVAINPHVFSPSPTQINQLSALLDMPRDKLRSMSGKEAYFAWLKRKIDPATAQKVEGLALKGLYLVNEATRFYPLQSVAAHLIGAVGSEDHGLMGIERQFQNILAGKSIAVSPAKDARGRTILYSSNMAAPDLPGHTIQLSLDHAIQEIAEESLAAGVIKARAKSGFVIVSDPHTGKILALANYPTFDPNNIASVKMEHTRNYGLLDLFEPGSIMKPFVIATAIEQKKTTSEEPHNCENGVFRVGGVVFRDDHPAATLTTAETLIRSSNICTYKIADRIGKQGLFDTLVNFGFSGGLSIPETFPTALHGHVSNPAGWKPIRFANIAFGQGLTVTGLEIAMAYGAIANGGSLMRPILVDRITSPGGEISFAATPEATAHVISPETAKQIRHMLSLVVTDPHGTGSNAATADYTTAGKTGTAEKVDPALKAYSPLKRIASFAGFAPAVDPYLVIYVMIDEPTAGPNYYGSLWAAPLFSEIAERSLRYLNVAPDRLPKSLDVAKKTDTHTTGPTASKNGSHGTAPVRL